MVHIRSALCLATLLFLLAVLPPLNHPSLAQANGITLYVNNGPMGSDKNTCRVPIAPCLTISAALQKAPSGATIVIAPNVYAGGLIVERNVTLMGQGAGSATILGGAPVIAIDSGVTATLAGLTITGGTGAFGGGILNLGTLIVKDSIVSNNTASQDAGGIYNYGSLTLSGSSIRNNTAPIGGGIENYRSSLTVTNSTISDNTSQGRGGGIENSGTLTIANSAISDNTAQFSGGGIDNYGATMVVSRSTISGNSAPVDGGGISTYQGATTVIGSTISGNSADDGGDVDIDSGTVVLTNTLLAGNTAPTAPDCFGYGTLVDGPGGHNLIGIEDGCAVLLDKQHGDQVGSAASPLDPHVSPLAPYGGPMLTVALQTGSPALGAGDPATCLAKTVTGADGKPAPGPGDLDQRGYPRRTNSRHACDIGAYDTGGRIG